MKHLFIITAILCILAVGLTSCKEENQPPTCEITAPSNAEEFSVGDNITISADAEDVDGSITEVRFYVNETGVGSANSFPYSHNWSTDAEEVGLYTIKATSYDDENASASDEVVIELISGGGGGCPETVTDIDGNTYNTVLIGNQCWMKENLKVTHYPNGVVIPYITENDEWGALSDNNTDDAYCFYDNNTNSEYGALYTYAAAIADDWERDNVYNQGICPDGWQLPTDVEWTDLEEYLIANGFNWDGSTSGDKTGKSLASTYGWDCYNVQGSIGNNQGINNSSGFSGLPGGYHYSYSGGFDFAGSFGNWWTGTESNSQGAWSRHLMYNNACLNRFDNSKSTGYSVRCLHTKE